MQAPRLAVVGAGPAGLMAAEILAQGGARVTLFERMPTPARKLLLAGRGGLNLTHSEPTAAFLSRYREARDWMAPHLDGFGPQHLRAWSETLGEPTFVGSSRRVFPRSFKTSPLLRAWLRRLEGLGVELRTRHTWSGFCDDGALRFVTPDSHVACRADAVVLALGGASWPHLGADGGWVGVLQGIGVDVAPLRPANCGFNVAWSAYFREKFAGQPLKNIALTFNAEVTTGEAVLTQSGIEGGVIYARSAQLRDSIEAHREAVISLDLRPDVSLDALAKKLSQPRGKQSLSTFLRKAGGLLPVATALLREAGEIPGDATQLAARLKAVPLRLVGVAPIGRAISSAGGVLRDELDANLMLRRRPGLFIAGEMIDWEAPTGGYLLQGCFSTGVVAGRGALGWMAREVSA